MFDIGMKPVLVIGATGYVGARLVARLVKRGVPVRAAGRSRQKLLVRPFSHDPLAEVATCDVLDLPSLREACAGCSVVYYLVHSMDPGQQEFSDADREGAQNMVRAAELEGVKRIIYLGGLGDPGANISKHLRSRIEVGEILVGGKVPVTILRAAMIIGGGSGSYEILRYLVDRLPVMITPRWVSTESQPIAIRNVLDYLIGVLEVSTTTGGTFDIGGPEVVSYRRLMDLYAEEAGLRKRWIIPVPVLTPRLSSYWIDLVTPAPAYLARPLAEGLSSRLVCGDDRIRRLVTVELLDCRSAIRAAIPGRRRHTAGTGGAEGTEGQDEAKIIPGDPEWVGKVLA
ncbi:MAG TPA: NAD(P)H-binding protein [Nitrospirota bacterium]|nr:NAD(P)H-binding protein [Nitrospirota bacterium]